MPLLIFLIVLFGIWRFSYAFVKFIEEYNGLLSADCIKAFWDEMLSTFCIAFFTGPIGVWLYRGSDMNAFLYIVLFFLGALVLTFGGPIFFVL